MSYIKVVALVAAITVTSIFIYVILRDIWQREMTYQTYMTYSNSLQLTQKQPHVLLIVVDDLGYNDVSYNGKLRGSAIRTPNIDKLAAEGITLSNYYVQPLCTPTRAQIMTGRYSIRLGLQHHVIRPGQPVCLPVDEVSLPEKLKELGYDTHAVGKWHLGFYKKECLPTKRGFDTFFGMYSGNEDHFKHDTTVFYDDGLNLTGYDFHRDSTKKFQAAWKENGQYSTEVFTREAQKLIKQQSQSKQPLFLYLPFYAVHDPIQTPEHYRKPYQHLIRDKTRQTLAGMISCIDEAIGNITNTLKETELYDNSVIIFSSDNGGAVSYTGNNWPLRGSKDTLWEGGIHGVGFIHSPLLPNEIRGTTSQAFIHVSDWFPTIISSLAGGNLSGTKPLDGYDVWESIVSNSSSPRLELLHNINPLPYLTNTTGRAALRMGDWKLIFGDPSTDFTGAFLDSWYPPSESGLTSISPVEPRKNTWLFNIAKDPTEKFDLSDERPGIVKRMLERLSEYNQTMVPPLYPDPDPKSDPALYVGVWKPWK